MKNKKILYAIIVIEMIAILGILRIIFNDQIKNQYRTNTANTDQYLNLCDSLRYESLLRNFCSINSIVKDSGDHEYHLCDYLTNYSVIFRFSENDCGNCAASELDFIKRSPVFKNGKLLILNSIKYNWPLKEKSDQLNGNSESLFINDSCILLRNLERFNKPYYVFVNRELEVLDLLYLSDCEEFKKEFILQSWFNIQNLNNGTK